ncbi:MAG: IS110 family transposase, partial [Methylocella sp.]
LMTIPGIHMIVALAIKAAVGDVERFARPQKLVSYIGLNPSVRQSGPGPAYHGRITKQGRGHARVISLTAIRLLLIRCQVCRLPCCPVGDIFPSGDLRSGTRGRGR